MTTAELIEQECDRIKAMLLEKNEKYGDSALNPVRVLSKASPFEQLKVRFDDKVSRLTRGKGDDEDTLLDATGYLVLMLIARRLT